MDPDANLSEQLKIAAEIQAIEDRNDFDAGTEKQLADLSCRLAELVVALNGWIVVGGFLPAPWKNRMITLNLDDEQVLRLISALKMNEEQCKDLARKTDSQMKSNVLWDQSIFARDLKLWLEVKLRVAKGDPKL